MVFIIGILLRAIDLYYLVLIAYAFLSWFPPLYDTVIGRTIVWMVRPILKPFRRFNLQFMGLDWTIFVVMVLMNLATRFLLYLF